MSKQMYLSGYGILAVFILLSIVFAVIALVIAWLIQPSAPNDTKQSTYECGMKLFGNSRVQFEIKYYLYALLFLVFDIETVFLFPWAVSFDKLGLFAIIEAVIFILILVIGLAYVWKKDVLKW